MDDGARDTRAEGREGGREGEELSAPLWREGERDGGRARNCQLHRGHELDNEQSVLRQSVCVVSI